MLNRKMQPAAVPPQAAVTRSALKDRLLDPRTLISFGILAVVLFVVLTHVQFDYGDSLRAISQTNVLIYALAFVAFYFSFVVRTIRWQILLRNTGESNRFGELFHIVILAWFANCVLPAKMGDFYRAYLLRQQTDVSGSKGLGTIFSERALDFLVLMSLLVISGLTVLVWMAESPRLFLVVQALPLHVSLSLAQIMFIALVASLLTTIPALPGGLVLVEGGIIAVLVFFGLTASQALSVAILDRL